MIRSRDKGCAAVRHACVTSGCPPGGFASIAILPLPVSIAHKAQPCQGEAGVGIRLEQGGGQGHWDVRAGVEQRWYRHAAGGDALALQRPLLEAALLPCHPQWFLPPPFHVLIHRYRVGAP